MNLFFSNEQDDINAAQSSLYYYKRVALYSLVISIAITLPFVLVELIKTGRPIFLYYGDYNAQQICFYEHAVDMVRGGNIGWDWLTDLGSNFMGSYSYYMLGSPFFWLMCLFPSSWAPYLMAPIYILKYITAAVIAYAFIKRFVKRQNYAVIGALLYAFCGFQIYNTFFNQFHEVVALFPLLLLGMEELIQNNRRGLFAIAVALNAMANYFMFAGQVVFCIIYFLFRLPNKSFRITLGKFLSLAFEAVIGVMIASVIVLPGALALMGNPRLDRAYSGWDMLYYRKGDSWYWQRYGHIFSSFFFPPDIPSRVNFFYGHTERWASISAYIPMFGMSGVFALFVSKKRTWLKYLIMFLIACLFIPILNSSFFLFNSSYYARWMYMLVLMMIIGTVIMLEGRNEEKAARKWKGSILTYLGFITAIFVPLGFIWYDDPDTEEILYKLGRPPYMDRFWIYTGIALLTVAILWYLFTKVREKENFESKTLVLISAITILYSAVHITNGKQHSWSSDFMINQAITGEVELDMSEFARMDLYRGPSTSVLDNLGLYWGYPSISCFHTVVPPSIMEFYPIVGVSRSVGSRAETKYYGLRPFLSVKYSFINQDRTHTGQGFYKIDTQNRFDIYQNEDFIPMGFTYTEFMTETEFESITKSQRHILLCTYLVVPDDLANYYSQFMREVKNKDDNFKAANLSTYTDSVAQRRQTAADSFTYDSYGFTSVITLESPGIVFFSVPNESGWSAKVNGSETEILRATYGFMAVECKAGENTIEFSYETPGLKYGLIAALAAILLLLIYLFICNKKGIKADYKFFRQDYYEEDKPVTTPVIDELSEQEETDSSDTEDTPAVREAQPLLDISESNIDSGEE